jgi:hypothetical protein
MNSTDSLIQEGPAQSPICPAPVFVIGAHRSGTTVLAFALAQHSHFWASDESFIMASLFGEGRVDREFSRWRSRPSSSWLRTQKVDREEFLRFLGLGFNALFTSRSRGKRWVDHTPHHALMADVLAAMFPGAYFVHVLREGRQVVNSMINVSRTLSGDERERMQKGDFLPRWATDFREACKSWRQHAEAATDFCTKHRERGLTVLHGELERDPEGTFQRVLDFLKAPQEAGPAAYLRSNRINSSFNTRNGKEVGQGKVPTPWDEWTAGQRQVFVEEAGGALVRLGFAVPEDLALSEYDEIVLKTREAVTRDVPAGAKVMVITKGDGQLLDLAGRPACHFPLDESGHYSDGNPADSSEAVNHLESARARGFDYLIIPRTAFWWLDFYKSFHDHLNACYQLVCKNEECTIYKLEPVSKKGSDPLI